MNTTDRIFFGEVGGKFTIPQMFFTTALISLTAAKVHTVVVDVQEAPQLLQEQPYQIGSNRYRNELFCLFPKVCVTQKVSETIENQKRQYFTPEALKKFTIPAGATLHIIPGYIQTREGGKDSFEIFTKNLPSDTKVIWRAPEMHEKAQYYFNEMRVDTQNIDHIRQHLAANTPQSPFFNELVQYAFGGVELQFETRVPDSLRIDTSKEMNALLSFLLILFSGLHLRMRVLQIQQIAQELLRKKEEPLLFGAHSQQSLYEVQCFRSRLKRQSHEDFYAMLYRLTGHTSQEILHIQSTGDQFRFQSGKWKWLQQVGSLRVKSIVYDLSEIDPSSLNFAYLLDARGIRLQDVTFLRPPGEFFYPHPH